MNTCPFDVDTARDALPADQLHHIAAVYTYRFYRPDEGVAGKYDWRARLADATAALEQAEALVQDAVTASREEGATWEQVGNYFGITKQSAQQRFGHKTGARK